MDLTAIFSVICIFIIAPSIVFGTMYLNRKRKYELEMMKYKKELLELEIEKDNQHIKLLEEENKKYDRLIGHN